MNDMNYIKNVGFTIKSLNVELLTLKKRSIRFIDSIMFQIHKSSLHTHGNKVDARKLKICDL